MNSKGLPYSPRVVILRADPCPELKSRCKQAKFESVSVYSSVVPKRTFVVPDKRWKQPNSQASPKPN